MDKSIIWLTGQPAAGKTSIAKLLIEYLPNAVGIDGDDIRDVFQNKDYSEVGRRNNIEKAQLLAQFMLHKGFTPIVSLVSPYRDQREEFKQTIGDSITEVYVRCNEDRGRNHFHVPGYQIPIANFIEIDTTGKTSEESFNELKTGLNLKTNIKYEIRSLYRKVAELALWS